MKPIAIGVGDQVKYPQPDERYPEGTGVVVGMERGWVRVFVGTRYNGLPVFRRFRASQLESTGLRVEDFPYLSWGMA